MAAIITREKTKRKPTGSAVPVSIDELLTYCVWKILKRKEQCTFERLVVECFVTFPKHFSLKGYPQYPDSARINKSWLRCRTDRGWITGSVKLSFSLSPAGESVAKRIASIEKPSLGVRKSTRDRTREQSLVRHVRNQSPFIRFRQKRSVFRPNPNDICLIASCTLDTPFLTKKENLMQLVDAAKSESDKDVLAFLQLCLNELLIESDRGNGGMRNGRRRTAN